MNVVELGPADDGRRVPVAVADTVLVRLPDSGAAGYGWDVAVAGPGRVIDDRVQAPAGPVAGAALVRLVGIVADAPGQVVLRAARRNPWGGTVEEYGVELDVN